MPDASSYSWPPPEKRKVIGKGYRRVDGPAKASGKAKYSSDFNRKDMLWAAVVTCPHGHARVTSIDTDAAEKTKGVTAVHLVAKPGAELQWHGAEVVAVAAVSEQIARDAARKVKVEYEVLPHMVREEDLAAAKGRSKTAGEKLLGDPDKAFQDADAVVSEGFYAIPVVTHCCLESHGQVVEWKGDQVNYWASTQGVSSIAGTLAPNIKRPDMPPEQAGIPEANIHVQQQYIGGAFGSKFSSDKWGEFCAYLSYKSGGRPVKLFLERSTDQLIAGNRPSAFAKIKVAARKDGLVTAWHSQSWATGGVGGGGMPPIPYVFSEIPNRRLNHTAVSVNAGSQRAWRAPNNQQASFLTVAALDDLAAKLNLDPVEFFVTNCAHTLRKEVYEYQIRKAAELAGWKKLWHPRGQGGPGPVKRGLGLGFNTWGGGGHASKCDCTIHADGSVVLEIGTQDLGTGTRTIILQVAAETLGLPVTAIRLNIGSNAYPASGASGGSTTVGGVSSSTRKATVNALAKLFEVVAPALKAEPDQLEAAGGRIQVKGAAARGLAWQAACKKLGAGKIAESGANEPKNPMGLFSSGVGGVQIADVSVDLETGRVKMNRFIAVQDCGMIVNPKLAESQCIGAITMGLSTALAEHRIMDPQTGRMLNADMEFYKLAGISDIGEIIVHLDIRPEHDKRGVIGLGEPPAVGVQGAVSNAVANAIGVRVPWLPVTPDRVLAALEGRNA
jgi:xanthine dehydrogenase YagR molybdenum-binding subunit